jgi:hypothetical protein
VSKQESKLERLKQKVSSIKKKNRHLWERDALC